MSGYGVAPKKSERAPVQHRPKPTVCGSCGSETHNGTLVCSDCAYEIVNNVEALAERHELNRLNEIGQ